MRIKDEPSRIVYLYKKFCPEIFRLLNHHKIWIEEERLYSEEVDKRESERAKLKLDGLPVQTTFVDVLLQCELGNISQKCFIADMDKTTKKLASVLPENLINGLRYIFKGKLSNLISWNYLNAFGELGVLDRLISFGYKLEQIEVKFPNKRPKDFLLLDMSAKPIIVEVLNIHVHKVEKQTKRNIKKYILDKIRKKIEYETEGISKAELENNLIFVPVIWIFGTDNLLRLFPFFQKFATKYSKEFKYPVTSLCSYVNYTDGKNLHLHIFGALDDIMRKPYFQQSLVKRMFQYLFS